MNDSFSNAADILLNEDYHMKCEREKCSIKYPNSIYPDDGFLSLWLKYTDPITEAPIIYLLLVGLVLLSTVVRDTYYFVEGDQKLKLNLYVLLSGTSTETKKTTAVNLGKRVLQHYFPDLIFPSRTTVEAFFSLLAGMAKDGSGCMIPAQTKGVTIYSEFGELTAHLKKDYTGGLKELITSAFDDCPPEDILTKKEGRIKPVIEFLNILAASTPEWITANLKQYELQSGFLARFLVVYSQSSDKCLPFRQLADRDLEERIKHELQDFYLIDKAQTLVMSSEAKKIYEQWYVSDKERGRHDTSETAVFFSRQRDYVKKIAALYQLSENGSATIQPENVKRAIDLVTSLRISLKYLVNDRLFTNGKGDLQQRIFDLIGKNPGIARSKITYDLRKKANAEQIDRCINSLVATDIIEEEILKTPGRDRKTYRFLV